MPEKELQGPEPGLEDRESRKEREIKLTYESLALDLYDEFHNYANNLRNDFPKSEFEIVQDNRDLADRVSDDEDNEEKDMGNVTLTFRFKATDDESREIEKAMNESFDPLIYKKQRERLESLFRKK